MQNILLATYSYYPYHWGGSEVYVRGLAKRLVQEGFGVSILAAIPEKALDNCKLIHKDKFLKIGIYRHEGIDIIGCVIDPTTDEIYGRYNPNWVRSWLRFLKKYWPGKNLDFFHMHANTPLVSAALSEAVKRYFPKVKTLFSYHVADSCPKGSLLYFNQTTCSISPNLKTCTACVMNHRWEINERTAKILATIWPDRFFPKAAPAKLRPKYLTKLALESFSRFAKHIDHWHVFSPQIATAIKGYGIKPENISVIRHGADDHYFNKSTANRCMTSAIFVYIGRFKKLKGLHTLLNAWNTLEENNNRKLWIIGDGKELESDLEHLIKKSKKRSDISFLGTLNVEDLREKLEQAHCIIIPSEVVETGPLVFHEAVACGTNVIASNIGGCASLVKYYGKGCQTFLTGDAESLLEKIKSFQFLKINKKVLSQTDHYTRLLKEYDRMLNHQAQHAAA